MAQPFEEWLKDINGKLNGHLDTKVSIVSVIGKGSYGHKWQKSDLLNAHLNRIVFQSSQRPPSEGNHSCLIDTFFDSQSQTVFFNAITPLETNRLFSDCLDRLGPEDNFFEFWSREEFEAARVVLFLFTISHVVLVAHPNCFFDISYVRFFRNLDVLRQKLEPSVSELLRSVPGVSKIWASFARPCPPRILFCFRRTQIRAESIEAKKRDPVHKLERCLEEQIYRILRKSRVVSNNVVNSLFAIPVNQEFVYIFTSTEEPIDMGALLMDQLNDFCKESGYASDAGSFQSEDNTPERSFYDFLMSHIDLAHEKGFEDSVGRNAVPTVFELPKLKTFMKAAEEVYKYLVVEGKKDPGMEELQELLNVELEFSERRCAKVYPMALNTYLDGLPQYYTDAQHKSRVSLALQILRQSRGPAQTAAVKKLMEECDAHWVKGHQACETLSLTGNNCVHKRHSTSDKKRDHKGGGSVMSHNSKVRFLSTCSCGHRQALREDPFEVKDANFTFYQHEDFSCCRSLEGIPIPTSHQLSPQKSADLSTELDNLRIENKLLDNLKITSQGDDFSDATGGSAEDFNPDRDNKQPTYVTSTAQLGSDGVVNPMDSTAAEFGEGEETILVDQSPIEVGHAEAESEDKLQLKTQEEEVGPVGGSDSLNELGSAGGSSSVLSDLLQDEVYFGKTSAVDNDEDAMIEELLSPRRRRKNSSRDNPNISQESEEMENEAAGDVLDESLNVSTKPLPDESQYTVAPPESPVGVERMNSVESTGSSKTSNPADVQSEEGDTSKLPEMLTNHSPVGLLPPFPSWSLLCLGHSSLYSHAHGLRDHPNFSHGSNYLLPLDFTLRVDLNVWQHKYDAMQTKRVPLPVRKPKKEDSTVTVKVFVGFEYECPRGHRYMLQTPSKVLKHIGPGGPKDTAALMAKSDMPLWFPCTCRVSKPALLGQLMRLHVVTPKAPVLVSLFPRVQPSTAHPVIFHSGLGNSVALGPAQYWVLRFPFCYVSDQGCFFPPKDSAPSGRVLKGLIAVVPDLDSP